MKDLPVSRLFLQRMLGAIAFLSLSSILLNLNPAPTQAGTIIVQPVSRPSSLRNIPPRAVGPNRDLFCRYAPTGQSVLGPDSFLILLEIQGNTTFRYERTDATLIAGLAPSDTIRTLTFFNSSARQAIQQLANRPDDYANLLGISPTDPIVRAGFDSIDQQFTCQRFNDLVAAAGQPNLLPEPQYRSISALPDGNYRVTTAAESSAANAFDGAPNSALFTFRKLGDAVTGNFTYPNSDLSACVSGTVEGNTVTGQAFTRDSGTVVIGQTYLGPRLDLRLGDVGIGNRYNNAVLNLNGFTRINAGTTVPPAVCS